MEELVYSTSKQEIQTSTGMFYLMCNYSSLWGDEVPSALCIVIEIEQERQLGKEKHKP